MNGCKLLHCAFWNGTMCTNEIKFVNQDGEEVCGLRNDAFLIE